MGARVDFRIAGQRPAVTEYTAKRLASIFGVPAHIIGHGQHSNYEQARQVMAILPEGMEIVRMRLPVNQHDVQMIEARGESRPCPSWREPLPSEVGHGENR